MSEKYNKFNKKDNFKTTGKANKLRSINKTGIWQTYLVLFGIIIFAAILYSNTIYNDFVDWDDTQFIFKNGFIHNLNWQGIKDIFTNSYYANYQPITLLSWMLEFKYWGFSANIYHLNNLIIHLLNIFLIFNFINLLTKNKTISLLTAFFFAIHPLNVESVAWISERKGLLCTFFYLLSLITYVCYLKNNFKPKFLVLSVLLFVFSLLSKAMAVTLPLILILTDYFYFERKILTVKCLLEKIPFFILSIIFAIICYYTQSSGGGVTEFSGHYSYFNRLFFIPYALSFYLIHFIFPFNLSIFHYYPEVKNGFLPLEYYLSPLFVLLIIWIIVRTGKNRKYILSGFLFFVIAISPVLQIIPIGRVIVSERYTYVPYLGLFLIMFTLLTQKTKKLKSIKSYIYIVLVIVSVYYSVLTWNRVKVWQKGVTLWEDFISENPDCYFGYYGLAGANYCKEIADYNKKFNMPKTNVSSEGSVIEKGDWFDIEEAIKNLTKCIALNPSFVNAYSDRGDAYLDKGDLDKAMADFNKVIELHPADQVAFNNLGIINSRLKKYDMAIVNYNKSLKINPVNPVTYFNRGLLYLALKDTVKACEDFKKSKSLKYKIAEKYIDKFCR